MNILSIKNKVISKIFTGLMTALVTFGAAGIAEATSYIPLSDTYNISLSPSVATLSSSEYVTINFNQVLTDAISNLSVAVYDQQHNLISDNRLDSYKFVQTHYPLAQTDVMCYYPTDDGIGQYHIPNCGGYLYATQFQAKVTDLVSNAGTYSINIHQTYTNGYANSLRNILSNTVTLTVTSTSTDLDTITITSTDSLSHPANTATTIAFSAGLSYGYAQTTFNTSRSQTVPGMTFTQGYAPCELGMACTQNYVANALFLSGTPTTPGTYQIVIDATQSLYPQCAAPIDGIAIGCDQVIEHGTKTFTLTITQNQVIQTENISFSYPVNAQVLNYNNGHWYMFKVQSSTQNSHVASYRYTLTQNGNTIINSRLVGSTGEFAVGPTDAEYNSIQRGNLTVTATGYSNAAGTVQITNPVSITISIADLGNPNPSNPGNSNGTITGTFGFTFPTYPFNQSLERGNTYPVSWNQTINGATVGDLYLTSRRGDVIASQLIAHNVSIANNSYSVTIPSNTQLYDGSVWNFQFIVAVGTANAQTFRSNNFAIVDRQPTSEEITNRNLKLQAEYNAQFPTTSYLSQYQYSQANQTQTTNYAAKVAAPQQTFQIAWPTTSYSYQNQYQYQPSYNYSY